MNEWLAAFIHVGIILVPGIIMVVFIFGEWYPNITTLPPWKPPKNDKAIWRALASVGLVVKPKLPCGCKAHWDDVRTFRADPKDDGTVTYHIGGFRGTTKHWREFRKVADSDEDSIELHSETVKMFDCDDCGESFRPPKEGGLRYEMSSLAPSSERTIDRPRPASKMRALPGDWTRLDMPLETMEGEVAKYVVDESFDAFVDVYDARHDNNEYPPEQGDYAAVLLTTRNVKGASRIDVLNGDDERQIAQSLMKTYNRGGYDA